MHRFRKSRSRILFEVFCALTISASCAGAWFQTGASALLPAAVVAALYGLVHAFDLAGRGSEIAADPQRIDSPTDQQPDFSIDTVAAAPSEADIAQPTNEKTIAEAEPAEPATPKEKAARRAKAPRKGGGRGASAPKEANLIELASSEETASIQPEAAGGDRPVVPAEVAQPHIETLFEPEPFVRMPRRAFGRKAG